MRTLGVVTSARSDFGFYRPLLRAIEDHPQLEAKIVATGMHLERALGLTVREIEEAGFEVFESVASLEVEGTPRAVARSMGRGVKGFAELFSRWRPDILLVLGDRYDMYPAALAALPFNIPVAHIAGGELTEGVLDDVLRHSLTKFSHLHFVAAPVYAERVRQLGEEPWRIVISGALALDNVRDLALWTREETARRFGFDLTEPVALVTHHPVTYEHERTSEHIQCLLDALDRKGIQCVFTYPNSDTGWPLVAGAIERFCAGHARSTLFHNIGQVGYFSLMNTVSVMAGNSSSGLVEAPSFELPVVNVGPRQGGRLRAANVIDCDPDTEAIFTSLERALEPGFRAGLKGLENPYGDGGAAKRIVERLAAVQINLSLLRKKFVDVSTRQEVGV